MQLRHVQLALASLLVVPGLATAGPGRLEPIPEGLGQRIVAPLGDEVPVTPGPSVSNIIFLNRCVGGCTVTSATSSDARTNMSSIPPSTPGTQHLISEFGHTEPEWQELLACVRAVYAPYNVVVTDVDPGGAQLHHEAIVAGLAAEIGREPFILGVGNSGCTPLNNYISFAFANAHADMENLCWTVAQESGHTYGLPNHVFSARPTSGSRRAPTR